MIQPAFHALLKIVEAVIPVDLAVIERAKQLVLGNPRLSARDAIHVAVIQQEGIDAILSFDAGFDGIPGISRLS